MESKLKPEFIEDYKTKYTWIPLSSITKLIGIRKTKPYGVELLKQKIEQYGFIPSFPLLVIPFDEGYELLNGGYRYHAALELGHESAPAIIIEQEMTDAGKKKLARQVNEATESLIPTNFIDDAEFIWQEADAGKTQAEIAEIMGWSREKVRNYLSLKNISEDAWEIIGTTFEKDVPVDEEEVVPRDGTIVPFTEGLLRSIIHLTSDQQLKLVKELADGTITKGKFSSRAKAYKTRNEIKEYAREQLASYGEEYIEKCFEEIDKGIFDEEWKTKDTDEKAGEKTLSKLTKLITSLKDEWEQKNSTRLIHGDFYEEALSIPSGSVDLVITDPPYNVSSEQVFKLAGRSDINQNFGEWDKYERQAFIDLFKEWGSHFYRILHDSGSGYIFTSDSYVSYLRNALEEQGLHVKATIVWHKKNPGTQVIKTNFRSSVEYILFFVKGEGHTFHWQGENEMHNHIEGPICQGDERIKDSKGDTLHPTQKPEYLIRHLMEISSNRGDIVFDGFAGVGTTAKVAKETGRKSISIEAEETFFTAMKYRVGDVS